MGLLPLLLGRRSETTPIAKEFATPGCGKEGQAGLCGAFCLTVPYYLQTRKNAGVSGLSGVIFKMFLTCGTFSSDKTFKRK